MPRAAVRPPIMPQELTDAAVEILNRHGMIYRDRMFMKDKPAARQWTWDTQYRANLIASPSALRGCCGVIEMYHLYPPPSRQQFPVEVTEDEWATLFEYNVRSILHYTSRRMAVATTIANQRKCVPMLRKAGFKVVMEGYNPGTRHKVTTWALSI